MKKIKLVISSALVMFSMVFLPMTTVQATVGLSDVEKETSQQACKQQNNAPNCKDNSLTNLFATIANILLFLVGAVAVIMLIVGGFRYVTSNGDQNSVTAAKNTILYAIIGIVVAFLAYAAVNFVTTQLTKGSA